MALQVAGELGRVSVIAGIIDQSSILPFQQASKQQDGQVQGLGLIEVLLLCLLDSEPHQWNLGYIGNYVGKMII